jgi:sporulation protein YlmC with PRC-barrel domain
MHVSENAQPRVTHILIGGPTLWMRLHPFLGRMSMAFARRWSPGHKDAVKIPWSRVETVGIDVKLDCEARETGALDWEIWFAKHVIERIPGGGSEEEE